MTAVYIICGIIVFLVLLLFIPISVFFSLNDKITIRVNYGLIRLFNSEKPMISEVETEITKHEKEKKKREKKEKPKKNGKIEALKKKADEIKEKSGTLQTVKYFFGIAGEIIKKTAALIRKFKVRNFELGISVATEDAAKTAIEYGAVCTAVYPVLSLLNENANVKLDKVDISADFNKTAYDVFLKFNVKTLPVYLIAFAVKVYKEYKKITEDV